jgi:hypothetical protein
MKSRNIGRVAVLVAGIVPAIAFAEPDEPRVDQAPPAHEFPLGTRTRDYLDRQRSGEESSNAHGLTPPAERRARKRYLQSFEHKIPDQFDMTGKPSSK